MCTYVIGIYALLRDVIYLVPQRRSMQAHMTINKINETLPYVGIVGNGRAGARRVGRSLDYFFLLSL